MLNQENNNQNQTGNPWDQINNSQAQSIAGKPSESHISQEPPEAEAKTEEKPKKQRLNPKDAKEEFDP